MEIRFFFKNELSLHKRDGSCLSVSVKIFFLPSIIPALFSLHILVWVTSLMCMCVWLLVSRRKSSGWCTFGLCVETRKSSTPTLPGGCWTSPPRAQSRSSEELEGTRACARTHTHGSRWKEVAVLIRPTEWHFSLKHDCTTWAVSSYWTWDWCHTVGCTCDCRHIVLHFRYRFVFSSSLCSRVCGKAVPFISIIKGIVQPDMLTRLSVSGKAQKPV